MRILFRLFTDLCLFRKTPQDVPYSGFLFISLLFLNIFLGLASILILLGRDKIPEFGAVLQYLAIRTAIVLLVIYLIMYLLGFRNRILQTLTALQGADFILGIVYLIIGMSVAMLSAKSPLFLIVVMLFLGWGLAVHSNILRHTLSTSLFTAGFLAVGLFFLEILVEKQLSPIAL